MVGFRSREPVSHSGSWILLLRRTVPGWHFYGGGPKKCGVGSGDPNLHSQPRLPGSVVGETSMR